ncbi:MAG: glycosyltransferase [Clostridiales bacterium]|nr:glycosyltransferase [Clostridiales bacterium]
MRIVELNMIHYGSTGKIMLQIADCARSRGHQVRTFSTRCYSKVKTDAPEIPKGHELYSSKLSNFIHALFGKMRGKNGCYSYIATKNLIRKIKRWKPDVIHLHNLHSFVINFPILFKYIKKHNIRTIWTLHDCWTFTGQCAHFDMKGCEKWKTGCHHCSSISDYPKVYRDNSKNMYSMKKKWFTGVENMTLVTPSKWLAGLVKQSFLKEYPVKVINNGIDLSIFKPTNSNFRQKYNLNDKFVILGVAFGWGEKKGLDVFIELSKRLDDRFKIVLVGTSEHVDKLLPIEIISIHSTNNQQELAEIYSACDLFVNPTREENFPTVNIEALACGLPVLTFRTGGSPEIVDATCGMVVEKNDVDALEREILRIYKEKPYLKVSCIKRAKDFDKNKKFLEYVCLYESI